MDEKDFVLSNLLVDYTCYAPLALRRELTTLEVAQLARKLLVYRDYEDIPKMQDIIDRGKLELK